MWTVRSRNRIAGATGSLEQTERIAAAVAELGYAAETITTPLGEPVAVRVPRVLSSAETEPFVEAAAVVGRDPTVRLDNPEISAVLPYGTRSARIYPKPVRDVLDAVARAATRRGDIAATELDSPEGGISMGLGDAGPHTDFPGNLDDPDPDEIHGLNVHLTLRGAATARFAPIRDFTGVEDIADRLHRMQSAGRTIFEINDEFDAIYAALMETACDPVPHGVGDMLVFQARPHRSKGLLPMVHHFASTTEDRWHVVFGPRPGDREETTLRRTRLIDRMPSNSSG